MIETKLPKYILEKAIKSGNEYGWKEMDFMQAVDSAIENGLAICGGQVQYVFNDGTCELYWLNYDPDDRKNKESWLEYSKRTAKESIEKFKNITSQNIELEAVKNFDFLAKKEKEGINISEHRIFILYFEEENQ